MLKEKDFLRFIKTDIYFYIQGLKDNLNYNDCLNFLCEGLDNYKDGIDDFSTISEIVQIVYRINTIEKHLFFFDKLFLNMYEHFKNNVKNYKTDFIYDLMWLIELYPVIKNKDIYWSIRVNGSDIGTDKNLVFNYKHDIIKKFKIDLNNLKLIELIE